MTHTSKPSMCRRGLLSLGVSALAAHALAGCSSNDVETRATAEAPREATIAPTSENVRTIGRTFEEDGVLWLPQSGSAVEFAASATRIGLEVVGDESVESDPDLRPRYAILVNGEVVVDDTLGEPSRIVEVPLDAVRLACAA